jgi:hypothetical protein
MEDGKIYLIDTNMNVIFTGTRTSEKTIFDSLLDGEHIKYDKTGKYINLYMAFDIYYVNRKSVREFIFEDSTQQEEPETKQRLPLLRELISLIKPISVLEEKGEVEKKDPTNIADFRIACKNFYSDESIFKACSNVLSKIKDSSYEYNTDGLIFTPSNLAAGGTKVGGPPGPLYKSTWEYSFKWKPPQFNTIDFLVTTLKGTSGDEIVKPIFEDGLNTEQVIQLSEYKIIELRCGFDERVNGYINPCQDIIDDKLPEYKNKHDDSKSNNYIPLRFYPTDPYDVNAGLCNIMLHMDSSGGKKMFSEENQVFEDNTIVEFRYDLTKEDGWKWVPLRVRYDKTAQLRSRKNNFGNQ